MQINNFKLLVFCVMSLLSSDRAVCPATRLCIQACKRWILKTTVDYPTFSYKIQTESVTVNNPYNIHHVSHLAFALAGLRVHYRNQGAVAGIRMYKAQRRKISKLRVQGAVQNYSRNSRSLRKSFSYNLWCKKTWTWMGWKMKNWWLFSWSQQRS